jgi:hypothetical protein
MPDGQALCTGRHGESDVCTYVSPVAFSVFPVFGRVAQWYTYLHLNLGMNILEGLGMEIYYIGIFNGHLEHLMVI